MDQQGIARSINKALQRNGRLTIGSGRTGLNLCTSPLFVAAPAH